MGPWLEITRFQPASLKNLIKPNQTQQTHSPTDKLNSNKLKPTKFRQKEGSSPWKEISMIQLILPIKNSTTWAK